MFSSLAFAKSELKSIVGNIDWAQVKLPFVAVIQTQNKYYKVTFFDDFKGKPDNSSESTYCYDTLKPQCSIWSSYEGGTFPCDLSHLSLTDPGPTPPTKANFKSALYSLYPSANYETLNLNSVKSAYATTLSTRWKDINKCNWTSYLTVNWMATDYNDHYAAKMDPTQISVDPRGKGYLIVSARKGKIVEQCIFGGTVGPSVGSFGKSCLLNNVQKVLTGPLGIYWIDPDIKWPGIFYHKIGGGCPYGGSGSVNCQVHSFAPGELSPLISYKLMSYNGNATLYYMDIQKYACGMNVEYPNNGVVFNKLSCPLFNGGILSQKAVDATNHKNGFIQKGGIFEVKLKIPEGKGSFPAAWLLPIKGGWPYSGGEIDIMEARDAADEVYQTYHQGKCIDAVTKTEIIYDPNDPTRFIDNGNCQKIPNAVSINYHTGKTTRQKEAGQFHTRDHVYSVEWDDTKIQWYLNNLPTNTVVLGINKLGTYFNNVVQGLTTQNDIPSDLQAYDTHNMPHDPFYWILNHSTWVGDADIANWTEQHHYIDYVKVYSECKSQSDFCPQGGNFIEGTGCVVSASPISGTARLNPTTYPSACVSNFKSRVCPAGGEVAGPNCQVHAFEKPKVIPGVNYWIDPNPNFPGVYYPKVNGACPFGGGVGVNCQLETLSTVLSAPQNKTVTPGVQYWVDTDTRWPGIYYQKINGYCPVGGSAGVNCQLKGYAFNFVRPGVQYWVDTDPNWPGVYYKKVSGTCPYGGSGSVNCQIEALSVPSFYLNPKVSYWLDTNINYPGIYYAKIGGLCPYGGSVGLNCQLKSYPKPTLPYVMPNVNYWVDANPDFPGIYYAKINGSCPYGGSVGVNCQLLTFPSGKVEPGVKYWIEKNPSFPGVYYGPDFR